MKVCIVGYGRMGRNHKRVLEAMGHETQTLDPSLPAAADHSQLTPELVDWTDVVCIATPIEDLARSAILWMERGKDVLIEKPGAGDLVGLMQLSAQMRVSGVFATVGYTERHNPGVASLQENLHRAGTIRHISARRLGYAKDRAGDPALDLMTHDLDVLSYLGYTPSVSKVVRSEHHVSALLRHHGTAISLEASHMHPIKVRELEVVGEDAVLHLDYQTQELQILTAEHTESVEPVDKTEPLEREWQAFFRGEGSSGVGAMCSAQEMVEPQREMATA